MSAGSRDAELEAYGGALAATLYEKSLDCVHCGLCLSACPTYRVTGRETASPRGRIYLMRGLAEGRLEETEVLDEEAFLCLGCRACETACPSGVQYGEMLEHARSVVRDRERGLRLASRIERFALRGIVARAGRLRALVSLLAGVQRLRLDRLARWLLPRRLRDMQSLLPPIPPRDERRRMPGFTAARRTDGRPARGRVLLFEGCIMPELFGRVNDAARRVLARAGYEVVVLPELGCCGALQAHGGDLETARQLARRNVAALGPELAGIDAIVVTSAGCSAALREMRAWIGEEAGDAPARVRDVLEFLADVGTEIDFEPRRIRVCYDDPCHLIHAQGISDAPRRLLREVPGLELVPHADAEHCCGAAGIYNLTHPEMSQRVLAPKLDALIEARPDVVATANPGCAMQLATGLAGRGHGARVVHPIELLEDASRGEVRGRPDPGRGV